MADSEVQTPGSTHRPSNYLTPSRRSAKPYVSTISDKQTYKYVALNLNTARNDPTAFKTRKILYTIIKVKDTDVVFVIIYKT